MNVTSPLDTRLTPPPRLEHFPVSFFGMSMGLFGLALALHAAGLLAAAHIAGWIAFAVFIVLAALYVAKMVRYPAMVREEWGHPVRLAFFPAISISLLLFATFLHHSAPVVANVVWIVAAVAQAALTLIVVTAWISHRAFGPGHLSPAWFIPAVGNVIAPLAGVELGHPEVSWYFFSVGLIFWLVLLTLVFNRLIFHDPLPERLRPTMVILIAPPALAFLAWLQFSGGEVGIAGRLFINIGYFFAALVAIQIPALVRLPFALSFWALSFPLAALTSASFRFAVLENSPFHWGVGLALLALLVLTIAALLVRTVRAALAGEICQPGE